MPKLQPPYRNETNQRFSKQLFHELWITLPVVERTIEPAFSLHLQRDGLICLGREYIKDCDPTGYTTAVRLFHDFGYWKHLLKAGWFRDALKTWDEELEAKLYSEGLAVIRALAKSDDKGALTAAKYLANKEFRLDNKTTKRGRPSSDEVEGRLAEEAREINEVDEDAARIRLVSVK